MAINLDELRARIDYARSKWPTWDSTPTENPEVELAELRATANQAGIPMALHRRVTSSDNWVKALLFEWCDSEQRQRDAWQRFREQIDAVAIACENQTSPSSDRQFDPVKYANKLSGTEKDVIHRYCNGEKLGDIAGSFHKRSGAKRHKGKVSREWEYQDTDRTIRAAKKAGYIKRDGENWKIVTEEEVTICNGENS